MIKHLKSEYFEFYKSKLFLETPSERQRQRLGICEDHNQNINNDNNDETKFLIKAKQCVSRIKLGEGWRRRRKHSSAD